jgi:hypothetical protein
MIVLNPVQVVLGGFVSFIVVHDSNTNRTGIRGEMIEVGLLGDFREIGVLRQAAQMKIVVSGERFHGGDDQNRTGISGFSGPR